MDTREADPRAHLYGIGNTVSAVDVSQEPHAVLVHRVPVLYCQQVDSALQETDGEDSE